MSSDNICCNLVFQNKFSDAPSNLKVKKKLSVQNPQTVAFVILRWWDPVLKPIIRVEFSKFFGNNDSAMLFIDCLCYSSLLSCINSVQFTEIHGTGDLTGRITLLHRIPSAVSWLTPAM